MKVELYDKSPPPESIVVITMEPPLIMPEKKRQKKWEICQCCNTNKVLDETRCDFCNHILCKDCQKEVETFGRHDLSQGMVPICTNCFDY